MAAYYNEFDKQKAAWLRELMRRGLIAQGDVDERSIADVQPGDVAGYERVHWFAGVGIWDYALTLAGWTGPVWTASCPCQPFSAAGKRKGKADERHLWPELIRLIRGVRPVVAFGEQVASKDGLAWLDDVYADLEAEAYTVGAVDTCAAGVGAPHIRQRLYWSARLADVQHTERRPEHQEHAEAYGRHRPGRGGTVGGLADAHGVLTEQPAWQWAGPAEARGGWPCDQPAGLGGAVRLEHDASDGRQPRRPEPSRGSAPGGCGAVRVGDVPSAGPLPGAHGRVHPGEDGRGARNAEPQRPGPVNGAWAGADWVLTRPQRVGDAPSLRPVEPGTQQMVDGSADCVGRMRPDQIFKAEEEVNAWAKRYQRDASKDLHDLRKLLSEEAVIVGQAGGSFGLFEAPILLAFLRQLSIQGWVFSDAVSCEGASLNRPALRVLRINRESCGSPLRPELEQQRSFKPSDALRLLSQVLARLAEECWGETVRAYAAKGFPLCHGAPARVVRLRGYGDGIVAPQAAAFVQACAEEWGI